MTKTKKLLKTNYGLAHLLSDRDIQDNYDRVRIHFNCGAAIISTAVNGMMIRCGEPRLNF
jgi:hypothetical protein